jgi:hypothetical protein
MPRKGEKPVNPFPKGEANPAHTRPLGIRAMLRGRYGENGEGLFEMLDEVATGRAEVIVEHVANTPTGPEIIEKTVRPTISERTTAIVELLGYTVGKPMQVNLNANVDFSPATMTDDELRAKVEQFVTDGTRPPQALPASAETVTVKKG